MPRFRLALAFALALAAPLAAPAAPLDLTAMSDSDRAAFQQEVRTYLLAHPEVLVEAIKELDSRQAAQQQQSDVQLVKSNANALFKDGSSYVGGNPNGNVTLVEFLDYRCAYCRKAYDEVNQLVKTDGNIRFVVKEFPILGQQSEISSRYAIAVLQADGPAAYAKVHDALMTFRGEVNTASLTELSGKFGLDAKDLLARMNSDAVTKVITTNRSLGDQMQISGTPTFVLADQMVRGYLPLDGMKEMVTKVRSE
jgi:protein-disulfide isomerase